MGPGRAAKKNIVKNNQSKSQGLHSQISWRFLGSSKITCGDNDGDENGEFGDLPQCIGELMNLNMITWQGVFQAMAFCLWGSSLKWLLHKA